MPLRYAALLAILLATWTAAPALARSTDRPVLPGPARFLGQVISLTNDANGNPVAFKLQQKDLRIVDLRLAPDATLVAMSAEASVEGFAQNDYALVYARRVERAWVAFRVSYDVQPIVLAPKPQTLTGTVQRVPVNGKRFLMKPDTTGLRWVMLQDKTKFRIEGQLVQGPPTLVKGEVVRVIMRRSDRGWVALDVNLLSTGSA